MGIKSALTAALSGAPADQSKKSDDKQTNIPDSAVFPGLSQGKGDDDVQREMEKWSLAESRAPLAGSAPTRAINGKSFTVDYELDPHSIHGGKEVIPNSLRQDKVASNFLSEAIIGSLPKALSLAERDMVLASTPLSPTLNLLSSMPSERVLQRSMDGARLRRHVLRGAVIVFITAGYSGKRFIFEKAKELGIRSIIIDGPDSWSKELEEEGIIEKFIGLDMSDVETVFDRCVDAVKKAQKQMGELDGICSFSEMAMPLVARLTEKLGLPGNPALAVDSARDKHATRRVMGEVGLPTPRNYLITEKSQVKEAGEKVGFPAVMKPIYGAASIGVLRVNNEEELQKAYVKVTKELASARIVAGALEQGSSSGSSSDDDDDGGGGVNGNGEQEEDEAKMGKASSGNASSWIRTDIMLEEYLDGPEVDVDLVFSDGHAVYGVVSDNWPCVEPYFNETGSNAPSILPNYQQKELLELSVAAVQCLGFAMGVFHVECKYTSRGPRLIEVNCRMGGGPVRTMNQLVWGVDLVEEALLCTAGIPARPPVAARPLCQIAEFSVNAMKTGIVKNFDFLAKYQDDPDVLYARSLVQPNSKVVCVEDGLPTWVCEMMVKKKTVDEAIDYIKKMEEEIQKVIPIDPLPAKKK